MCCTKSGLCCQKTISAELKSAGAEIPPDREIVALISYLQKLGKSEKVNPASGAKPTAAK